MGRVMGYKDVSNYVSGPKHTRHAITDRVKKLNSGNAIETPFWQSYARGARRSADDWMNHISKATGGRNTRTMRRLSRLTEKI